jgi:hypothetical protein
MIMNEEKKTILVLTPHQVHVYLKQKIQDPQKFGKKGKNPPKGLLSSFLSPKYRYIWSRRIIKGMKKNRTVHA